MSHLIIKIAKTEKEKAAAYRVRYDVFCKEIGIFNPNNYTGKKETDKYDKRSIHFIAVKDNQTVGTARLVLPKAKSPLPSEKDFSFPKVYETKSTVEISRGALLKKHRNMLGISIKVLDYIYEYCKKENISYIIALANYDMYLLYKKLRVPFTFVDDPIMYKGFKTVPLVFGVSNDVNILKKRY